MSAPGGILVTGASGSLGTAIANKVSSTPYHGLFAVRTPSANLQAIPSATVLPLDPSRLDSVRYLATRVNDAVSSGEIPPIRALVHNAAWQEYDTQT